MSKHCLGSTNRGTDCRRPVIKNSNFCYLHKSLGEDSEIKGKINDIYMCPNSCEELNYWHRYGKHCYTCTECNGVLLNDKHDLKDLILRLPRSDDLSLAQLGCPTCCSSDYSDSNSFPLTVFVYLWLESTDWNEYLREFNICFCNTCESIWIPKFRSAPSDCWPSEELLSVEKQNYLLAEKELRDKFVSSVEQSKADLQQREEEEEKILNDYGGNCIFIDSKGKQCLRPRISGEVHCFAHRNFVKDEEQEIVEKPAFGSKLWFTENIPFAALILWLGIVFTFDLNTLPIDIFGINPLTFTSTHPGAPIFIFGLYILFFIWPLFVNYKKLIEKI